MSDPDAPLAGLQRIIVGAYPELAGAAFHLIPRGWDSMAVQVDGCLIFKFPRHEAAEVRLAREARVLAAIRSGLTMPVPDMILHKKPRLFTLHEKLIGDYLTPEAYAELSDTGRARVARQLAEFCAQLHALDPVPLSALGVGPIQPWLSVTDITARGLPLLPAPLRNEAAAALTAYADLPPDPHGETFGYFDGHGWNMAFDAEAERLNGVYDFGDCGFAGLHQEFVYSNLIAFDLTARIVGAYEVLTGRALDRPRIHLLTGLHALSELAENAPEHVENGIARLERWRANRP